MKKLLVILLVLLVVLTSCASQTDNEDSNVEENQPKIEEIVYDKESLAEFNGKDGKPAYVAVDGVVYDVSDEPAWQTPHQGKYEPGKDYSKEMREAPHGLGKLEGLPVVGKYEDEVESGY